MTTPPAGSTRRRDRGATLPIVAILLPVLILMTAFAVDLGRQRASRRSMQARADVIALDMVRIIGGRDVSTIVGTDAAATEAALVASATRNEVDRSKVTLVEWGLFDAATTPQFTPLSLGYPNAVRITMSEDTDYFFQPGSGRATRTAVATQQSQAGFSIGSYAAAVRSGGSTLLNPLIGNALGLGVLGYDGLASFDFTYLDIATEMGLLTPEELFDGSVSAFDVIDAAATIIQRNNPSAVELIVLERVLSSPASDLDDLDLGDVVDVTSGSEDAALGSTFNLFDFVATSAFVANGSSGLSIPTLNLGTPGFDLNGTLNLIQRPATAYGGVGTSVETSQADTVLTSSLGTLGLGSFPAATLDSLLPGSGSLLCGVLGFLLCGSKVVTAQLSTVVDLDLASARGTIAGIRCPGAQELDVDVSSQLLTASISVQVTLKSGSTTLGSFPLSVVNTRPPVPGGTVDFVIPPDAFDVFKPASPPVGSIAGNTTLSGLGPLGPLLTPALNTLLGTVVARVNSTIVTPLATALGANIASADVAPRAIDCNGVKLVG